MTLSIKAFVTLIMKVGKTKLCHFADCCSLLNFMLNVIMLNAAMLSVVTPFKFATFTKI